MSTNIVAQIRKSTRRKFTAEQKIRIVLEGLRGQEKITEVCRRNGIAPAQYHKWSKSFLDGGKNALTLDIRRDATGDEVRNLREEVEALQRALSQSTLEVLRYKKNLGLL
jgi:transposase